MKRRTPLVDAGRRGARRAAAADRLDGVARQHRSSAARRSSRSCSCWQIPHFMAIAWLYRDDYGKAGFPMLPVIDPDGRRAGKQAVSTRRRWCRSAWCRRSVGLAGHGLLRRRARARRRAVRCSRSASPPTRNEADARARCSSDRSPTCRCSGSSMIAEQAVTRPRSAGRQRHPQRAVGHSAARRLRADPAAADRRSIARCMLAAFATSSLFLICYLVYHAQVGSVPFPRQGFVRPLYFTILITHVVLAATVPPLAIITLSRGLQGTLPAAPPHRALDVSDLAVRVGDRRARLRAALPADLAALNRVIG